MNEITESVAACAATHRAGKYLTFRLHQESYGIAVLQVREIMRLPPITTVPRMPEHIKGVINLRGKIIPVIDLRLHLGLQQATDTEKTCIVVVQVKTQAQAALLMGLIVDAVEEVANIGAGEIEEAPAFGVSIDTAYILGMAKVKGGVKILININQMLDTDTLMSLSSVPKT